MAYVLSDIRTLVQKRVRDTSYDTSEITQYINDTQNDVFNEYRLNFMEKFQDYTTVASVEDITNGTGLPVDYQVAIDLLNVTNGGHSVIPYINVIDRDTLSSTNTGTIITTSSNNSQPAGWYRYSNKILMYRPPALSLTVRLRYYKAAKQLSNDTDIPELPYSFQELLVLGAAYRILQVKDNYDQAAILQNKYDEILDKLVGQTAIDQVGKSPTQRINRYSTSKRNF